MALSFSKPQRSASSALTKETFKSLETMKHEANEKLNQGESTETREMLYRCSYLLMENGANEKLNHQIFQLDKIEEKSWTPPPENTVRIDVDGSVLQQHQAACGGVLRNTQGDWLMGFYKPLGLLSVIEAEIYAIMIGLQIGLQMGLQRIVIYSDSLDAVNILMRDCPTDHPLKDIVGATRDLLFQDWDVELHHTPRENIPCADYMAKKGHSVVIGADVVMIPTIPRGCLDIVLKDKQSCNS